MRPLVRDCHSNYSTGEKRSKLDSNLDTRLAHNALGKETLKWQCITA